MSRALFVADRVALVGDAAHVIHPIAGQGLNMGLKDVAALAEVIVDAARLGLDPGTADVLERYQRWRRFDTVAMGLATDGLNRLFSNRSDVLRLARDVGLGLVDRLPGLKRLFIREAAGLVGEVPKLLRGETSDRPGRLVIASRLPDCGTIGLRIRKTNWLIHGLKSGSDDERAEKMPFNHIAVIGGGAWGTALALTCARRPQGHAVGAGSRQCGHAEDEARESLPARRAAR